MRAKAIAINFVAADLLKRGHYVYCQEMPDEMHHRPAKGCAYFGAQLTAAGNPHELRSYDGDHESRLVERIGRYMLPFLSERLSVE